MTNTKFSKFKNTSRRTVLKHSAAGAVVLGSPAILSEALGETPIKIGIPTTITGTYAEYGSHVQRTAKLIEKEDTKEDTVVQEIQSGYMLHDRVIRPAMVVISK